MKNIPNLITLLRLLLVPVAVLMIAAQAWGWAFAAFAIAGLSDGWRMSCLFGSPSSSSPAT